MADSKTPSRRAAFLAFKCPHCYSGHVFRTKTFSTGFTKMHEHCPVCGQKFEIEPGFFWGSMYVSYFITVIIGFAIAIGYYWLVPEPPIWQVILAISLALLILTPLNFRLSRMIMLYSFASIKYDPEAAAKKQQ